MKADDVSPETVGDPSEHVLDRDEPLPEYASPRLIAWRRRTDGPLLVLAIGSLPVLLLELRRSSLIPADRILLDVVNVLVLVAFAVDYFVELAVASNRRSYVIHEWTSALIVVSQGLALMPQLAAFGVLRGLRALRPIIVFARLLAIGGAAATEGRSILRRHAYRFAFGVAGLTWVSAAVAFTLAEDVGEDGRVHSFGDALWWSLSTMTTVGYGDI